MNMNILKLAFAVALIAAMPFTASADVMAIHDGDVRITGDLDDLPGGGNAGDENGGNTLLVVGVNTGNVQNWALFGFDTSAGAGEVATGAELVLDMNLLTNGNHGDASNTFGIHELYSGNLGWVEGGGGIQNSAMNVSAPGLVTFQQRAFDGGTGNGIDWVDGAGTALPNFIGSFDPAEINTNTVNGWENGTLPNPTITFEFDATTAQSWLDNGRADLVLEVNDPDGMNTSRFVIQNGAVNALTVFTVPEPSAALLLLGGLAAVVLRRRR